MKNIWYLFLIFIPVISLAGEDPPPLEFWGRVHFNIHQDTNDLRPFLDFATHVTGEGPGKLNFNPRDTRFGAAANARKGNWLYGLKIEIDFYGENSGNNLIPRMRLGYVSASNNRGFSVRMGQDWIPIATRMPATLDFGVLSWGGNLWWRVPQITLRQKQGNFEALAGVMKHRISNTQESVEKWPWFFSRMAFDNGAGLLALGGAWRPVTVVDSAGAELFEDESWLAALEWSFPLWKGAKLVGEAWSGEGVGREFVRYGLDYNLDAARVINGSGGFMSFSQDLGKNLQLNMGGGLDRPEEEDTLIAPGTAVTASVPFLRNQTAFLNLKKTLGRGFGAGVEVMYFRTRQPSYQTLTGFRYSVGVWYRFKSGIKQ